MRVLILSAYDAFSHTQLNKGLIKNLPEIEFTLLSLPPRYFAWRSRGNSLSFAFENRDELEKGYDVVFATSLTDITSIRGFVPSLAGVPLIVYFHENQFDYPDSRSDHQNIEAKIVSIYNALAADKVIFNTDYNRRTFLDGAAKFLKKMPDHVPYGLIDLIKGKSVVLSVPINPVKKCEKQSKEPVILWNHRWEYDKGPEKFLLALRELKKRINDFRLNIAGQVFRDVPESFKIIEKEFADHIDHFGYAESREQYERLVADSNIIISTSLHDYQGLSVIEAADAGCTPVLPERLAYTEIFPSKFLYKSDKDENIEAVNCAEAIINAKGDCDVSRFYWSQMADKYINLFNSILIK